MTGFSQLLRALMCAFLIGLSLMAPAKAADSVTRTITNTASLSWMDDGVSRTTLSNKVDLSFASTANVSFVFDSRNGSPITGVRITLIDVTTGRAAEVFGTDAVSNFPSTITSGQTVMDAGGRTYELAPGAFAFPWVPAGTYRLQVEAPPPYSYPSTKSEAELRSLQRPDGAPFVVVGASFGRTITLAAAGPLAFDVPLDRPAVRILLSKVASRPEAEAGDLVRYELLVRNPESRPSGPVTIMDEPPSQMRYRVNSARLDGSEIADPKRVGQQLAFELPSLPARSQRKLAYLLEVRPDARSGDAVNRARATADGTESNTADAVVRIIRDKSLEDFTIIGRVIGGECGQSGQARGVPGIRIMLQDGSYAVSDNDGRFHFEAVRRGTHVVQLDRGSLPSGTEAVACQSSVRNGSSAFSSWVEGRGGELKRLDFYVVGSASSKPVPGIAAGVRRAEDAPPPPMSTADFDWLAGQQPGVSILYPTGETNPRSPVTRVVVKHRPDQSVSLRVDGRPAMPVSFDGTRKDPSGKISVSSWRGISLDGHTTELDVEVRNSNGELVQTLHQTAYFSNLPARVQIIREKSVLVADGVRRPVIALRVTDRHGRPVHHGVSGSFQLPSPYLAAIEADAQQARQLAGLERASPTWQVSGDDGLALVELEPTTASGGLSLRFPFREGVSSREQRVDLWLSPGERPWTVVGLAEGTVGYDRIDKNLEKLGADTSKDLVDGRLALYAKGRVLGRWLMTLAYDSDKTRDQTRFGGVIDPQSYYTIYADRSERRYDAASVRKLYLRLERPQFLALFGDYETGIDEPLLARYVRSLNGGKAEFRSAQVSATAFAADTPFRHQRDEIQGNGLSGPYALSKRRIVANSERIMIEVRDRFRSEKILEQRLLSRQVDYDIDYLRGTVRFREPILSRSSGLNPQFIIADYEVEGVAGKGLSAGARASWQSENQQVKVGTTVVHDDDGQDTTNLAGADVKVRLSEATEVRAEVAATKSEREGNGAAHAWLVEVEHRTSRLDALAYAGERQIGFGLGQTNAVESGTRKFGFDARYNLSDAFSISGSGWFQNMLATSARRAAGRVLGEYRSGRSSARVGLVFARDELADGDEANSTLLTVGGTTRLLNGRVEIGADSEFLLSGSGSIDFPARHRVNGRFAVNRWASLVASYEVSSGVVDARTARVGFDLAPWAGGRIAVSGNLQAMDEYGPRSFAAFGLAQSIILSPEWSVDMTVDSNRTLSGVNPSKVLDPLHPVASGGYVGSGGVTEDFTAVTAGATYRKGPLSTTARAELRVAERERRTGVILGALRQIGEGRALGASAEWYRSELKGGALGSVLTAQFSWAYRPAMSKLSLLNKLSFRRDAVSGASRGQFDALGQTLMVDGDLSSSRLKNALALNYSDDPQTLEFSLFWGLRYVSDQFGEDDIEGWSNLVSLDGRVSLTESVEVGGSISVRHGLGARSLWMSGGPQIGVKPMSNGWLVLGYNVVGYRDRDFGSERFTRSGPYASFRFKFDELTLASMLKEGQQ